MERMEMDLGFATLVVEKGPDKNYREMNVYIEDKDGVWIQDIVVIRQAYHYEKDLTPVQEEKINVLVWSDAKNEGYTHKFNIGIYEEEE